MKNIKKLQPVTPIMLKYTKLETQHNVVKAIRNLNHAETINPAGKIAEKAAWRSVFLTILALHIEYPFNKSSLLRSYFLAILPAGKEDGNKPPI